jgi:4-carboxymuconolactone decarboxylase
MTENAQPSSAQQLIGDVAPKLVSLTDDVLFGDVWERSELSPRDRSLVTISALVAGGHTGQLPFHLDLGRHNGLTEAEIVECITHLAFYCGWPRAMSAIVVAKEAFAG